MARRLRRRRRQATRHGLAVTRAARLERQLLDCLLHQSFAFPVADARVDQRVRDIGDDVRHDEGEGEDQHEREDDVVVAAGGRLDS